MSVCSDVSGTLTSSEELEDSTTSGAGERSHNVTEATAAELLNTPLDVRICNERNRYHSIT